MKKICLILIFIILINTTGCTMDNPHAVHSSEGICFNTYISIKLYGCGSKDLAKEAVDLCREYEAIFSRTLKESHLYELNETGYYEFGNDKEEELYSIISSSLRYCELTDGSLDITVEPLTSLWNFSGEDRNVPDADKINYASDRVNYKLIEIDEEQVALNGARLDLGAVAKGYVADRVKEYLISKGVTSAMINLGGNILCIGNKPGDKDFVVGIKKPFSEDVCLALKIDDLSVVTSGTYERYFEENGKRYHHILNPKTGMPCDNGILSVTIISEESFVGDCLSTGCFVMGIEDSMELVSELEGVYAIFIDETYQIHYSEGAEKFINK